VEKGGGGDVKRECFSSLCRPFPVSLYLSENVDQRNNPTSPLRRMPEWEDRALVSAIARRDHAAFERFYDRYHALVYHLVLKILHDRSDAEEVVYQIFWQVWREAGKYEARRGSVITWLSLLARSRAIDAVRSRRDHPVSDNEAQESATEPADGPEEVASLGQRSLLVRDALADLPQTQRVALELTFFGGLTHVEIAEQLGEPLGTIKTRIRAAMLRLRDQLHPLLGRET
jgi:RNA polymerase sigma-70 factor, ECF subfamily